MTMPTQIEIHRMPTSLSGLNLASPSRCDLFATDGGRGDGSVVEEADARAAFSNHHAASVLSARTVA